MIKIKSQELVLLVKSLTKPEKSKFKDSISYQNRTANFYQLFDYIDRTPSVDISKIRQLFKSETTFFDAKKYLFNRIIDVLINETVKSDKELEYIYNTQLAYVLYKKNMFDLSEKILKEIAQEQTNSIQAGIQVLVTVLLTRIGFMKQDLELLNYSDSKQQELLNYIAIIEKYRSFKIVIDSKYDDLEYINNELQTFIEDEKYFTSPRDINGYNYFMALLFELKLFNFEKAFIYHQKSFNLYLSEFKGSGKTISLQNIEVTLIIFYHNIVSSILLGKVDEADEISNEFELFDNECHLKNDFYYKIRLIVLNFYTTWTSKDAEKSIKESIKYAYVCDINSFNTLDLYAFLYFNCNLFQNGKYKEVVINMISNYNVLKNRPENEFFSFYLVYNYFLLIFSHLKLKNYDVVETFIQKLYKEKNISNSYLTVLIKIITAYSNLCIYDIYNEKKYNTILESCDTLQSNPYFKIYPFMDIKKWIFRE